MHSFILDIDIELIIYFICIYYIHIHKTSFMISCNICMYIVHVCQCQCNSTTTIQILNQTTNWRHDLCYYYLRKQFSHLYESILAAPSSPCRKWSRSILKFPKGVMAPCGNDSGINILSSPSTAWCDHSNALT